MKAYASKELNVLIRIRPISSKKLKVVEETSGYLVVVSSLEFP